MSDPSSGFDDLTDYMDERLQDTPEFQQEAMQDLPPSDTANDPDGEASTADDGPPLSGYAGASDFPMEDLRDRVVIMLLFKQKVTMDQVAEAWEAREEASDTRPLWRFVAEHPGVDREEVFAEAAGAYAFDRTSTSVEDATAFIKNCRDDFSEDQWTEMRQLEVLPVRERETDRAGTTELIFVSHDPTRKGLRQEIREIGVGTFDLEYAPPSYLKTVAAEALQRRNEYLERMGDSAITQDLGASYDEDDLVDQEALEDEISRSGLINLFEATLVEAVREGVSDVHIFPNAQRQIEIHFRKDGELFRWHIEERGHPEAFFAVVKDNSMNVDRFERDDAQDGFIQRLIDDTMIRFRVSVLPISSADQQLRAESIVIRVLDDRKVITDLGKLGLQTLALERFENAINQPYGMVVLTGPTGSGKTTTLYAALHNVVTPKKNALTVEDPVEYILPGVRQLRLNQKLKLDRALRSILRHDPDIVMVGEMRDRVTAELAIKLANTGHLTFSTLHTNDAPSAVSRLYKMGIEPFLIANAINLVVAQRLVRTLCSHCKRSIPTPETKALKRVGFTEDDIAATTFFGPGSGCKHCGGSGHSGRRAITETLPFTDPICHIILTAGEVVDEEAIRAKGIEEGMLTLQDSARNLVIDGAISLDEMMRVTATGL